MSPTLYRRLFLFIVVAVLLAGTPGRSTTTEADEPKLRQFGETMQPFLQTYCHACHGKEKPKGKLDLTSYSTVESVARSHATWELVLERLEAGEMPPEEARRQPTHQERQSVVAWIRALRKLDAERTAGDPGVVPARRLSNAE